MREILAT